MKCYYAHSMLIYDRQQEKRDVVILEELGFEVFNPNSEECSIGYREHGMDFFSSKIADCDALAFRAHPDGSIPAGVAKEIEAAVDMNRPVFELPSGVERRSLTIGETREFLHQGGQR